MDNGDYVERLTRETLTPQRKPLTGGRLVNITVRGTYNRPCPAFRATGSSKPDGVVGQKCRHPAFAGTTAGQWAWMRRVAARSSGVPASEAMTACLRIAFRVATSHCSHSRGLLRFVVGVQGAAGRIAGIER